MNSIQNLTSSSDNSVNNNIILHLPLAEKDVFIFNLCDSSFLLNEERPEPEESIVIDNSCIPTEKVDNVSITVQNLEEDSLSKNHDIHSSEFDFSKSISKELENKQIVFTVKPTETLAVNNYESASIQDSKVSVKDKESCSKLVTRDKCSKVTHIQILTEPSKHTTVKYYGEDNLIGEGFQCHLCTSIMPTSGTLRHHLVTSHDLQDGLSHCVSKSLIFLLDFKF